MEKPKLDSIRIHLSLELDSNIVFVLVIVVLRSSLHNDGVDDFWTFLPRFVDSSEVKSFIDEELHCSDLSSATFSSSSSISGKLCFTTSIKTFTTRKKYIFIYFGRQLGSLTTGRRGFTMSYISYDVAPATTLPPTTSPSITVNGACTSMTLMATTSYKYYTLNGYLNNNYCNLYFQPSSSYSSSSYFLEIYWYGSSPQFDVKGTMPGCTNDYVQAYLTSSYKSIGRYCSNNIGNYKPSYMFSHDGKAKMRFYSDSSITGTGFKVQRLLMFFSIVFVLVIVVLRSSLHNDGVDDFWTFLPRFVDSSEVKSFIDEELHCSDLSSATFSSSSSISGKLCFTTSIKTFTTRKKYIFIYFGRQLGSLTTGRRGFTMSYISYDVAPATTLPPTTSPSITVNGACTSMTLMATTSYKYYTLNGYLNNNYCNLYFQPSSSYSSSSYFLEIYWYGSSPQFDVKGTMPGCTNDYVQAYLTSSYKSIGRYCSNNIGNYKPSYMFSHDGKAKMRFYSDSSITGTGFKVQRLLMFFSIVFVLVIVVLRSSLHNDGVDDFWTFLPRFVDSSEVKSFIDEELHCSDLSSTTFSSSSSISGKLCFTTSIKTFTTRKKYIFIYFGRQLGSLTTGRRGFTMAYISYDVAPLTTLPPTTLHPSTSPSSATTDASTTTVDGPPDAAGARKSKGDGSINLNAVVVPVVLGILLIVAIIAIYCYKSRRRPLLVLRESQLSKDNPYSKGATKATDTSSIGASKSRCISDCSLPPALPSRPNDMSNKKVRRILGRENSAFEETLPTKTPDVVRKARVRSQSSSDSSVKPIGSNPVVCGNSGLSKMNISGDNAATKKIGAPRIADKVADGDKPEGNTRKENIEMTRLEATDHDDKGDGQPEPYLDLSDLKEQVGEILSNPLYEEIQPIA
eukprot:gene10762-11912_t